MDNATVLVVDDDPLMREIIGARLRQDRFEVIDAEDGIDALDTVRQHSFDLVIADIEMPRMDGFALIKQLRLREETANLPVIVVTGIEDSSACRRAFDVGATAFITKPVNWALLTNQVAYVLRNARHERELFDAKQQLESALRSKDHMLSVISHELRTPLHSVTGFAKLISDEVHGPLGNAAYAEYALEIENAGKVLNNRVSDMLLLAQLLGDDTTFDFGEYDLEEILMAVRGAFNSAHTDAHPSVEIDIGNAGAMLKCNAQLLTAAIRHLVENSYKFCDSSVEIEIGVRSVDDVVICYVRDNGPGIPEAIAQQCTEPFHQAEMKLNRSKDGLGLGLTIARAVAVQHGGELCITSPENGGTLLEMVLPRHHGQSQEAQAA